MVDILSQIQYLGQQTWDKFSPEEKETHLVIQPANFEDFVKNGYCFLVESGNDILGFILAYETIPVYQEIYVKYIAVDPSRQGQGIGSSLYKNLIATASKNNIKKIWGIINLDNPKSIKAALKAGFNLNDRKEAFLTL